MWRLNDGNATISVKIEDEDFLRRVDSSDIALAKGDILRCTVRIKKYRVKDVIKTDHVVQKVIEHRPAARQLNLGLGD